MRSGTGRILAVLTIAAWGLSGAGLAGAAAQEAAKATSVDVGNDAAEPGDRATLPIMLAAPDGVRVGTTINEITFPVKVLSFEEALADHPQVRVTAKAKPDPENASHSRVEVTVTDKEGGALPPGLLASAVFRVAKDAPAGAVTLKNVPRALAPGADAKPIAGVAGRSGEIEVMGGEPKVFACFFYMH
jgi:hypothetical protein